MKALQILLISVITAQADLKSDLGLESGDFIVMAGDSITAAQKYSNYIAAWFALNYPDDDFTVPSLARSGASSNGWNVEEYEKRVYALDPDVVFLMLGHNDGSDLAAQAANTQSIVDDWILGNHPDGVSAGVSSLPVFLGGHPTSSPDGKTIIGDFNDNYQTIATAGGYKFSHNWDRLSPVWIADYNANNPPLVGGADAIHPGTVGHILIAWSCLKGLGVVDNENLVSSASINGATGSVTASVDCTISNVTATAQGVEFTRLDARLPWAIDEAGRANAESLVPGSTTWQNYLITVTNLAAGDYEIRCDGELVATATAAELASGVNLAGATQGPVWAQGQETLRQQRLFQGVDPVTLVRTGPPWSGVENYLSVASGAWTSGLRGDALRGNLASRRSSLKTNSNTNVAPAAQPVARTWTIQAVGDRPTQITGVKIQNDNISLLEKVEKTLASGQFTMPPGIPYPSEWGTTNPFNDLAPTVVDIWADKSTAVTGNYYVDSTHPESTDTSNNYGYPNKPRRSIPDGIGIQPGKVLYIAGGVHDITAGDKTLSIIGKGEESNPAWVVCEPDAQILGVVAFHGYFMVVDGMRIGRGSARSANLRLGWSSSTGQYPAHHICFRGGEIKDVTTYSPGFGSMVSIAGYSSGKTTDIILHDTEIKERGSVQTVRDGIAEDDEHGVLPGQNTERIYITGCRMFNLGGDCVQVGGNNSIGDARARYIYLGYNHFYHTGENAIDIKSGRDVIFSSNICNDFAPGAGSDGTAVVVQQEGGTGSENCWFLFNEVYDCPRPFRSEEVTSGVYLIGNVIHSMTDYEIGADNAIYTRTASSGMVLVDNTIHGFSRTGLAWDGQGGNSPNVTLHGNIFSGKSDDAMYWIEGDSTINTGTSNFNLFDSSGQFRVRWNGKNSTDLAAHRSATGQDMKSLVVDPRFNNSATKDFRLLESSPAIGASTEHAAYAAFEQFYGLNIRKDFSGMDRPANGPWTIGAMQSGTGIHNP